MNQLRTQNGDQPMLLCENCGYPIHDLAPENRCPECGTRSGDSYPESRPGSPWQRSPGASAWIATNWGTLRHSHARFRTATIEVRRSRSLLIINLVVAGTILASPWTGALVGDPARGLLHSGFLKDAAFALWTIAQSLAAAGVLLLLTYVEFLGIRFFGGKRGWRITKDVALQVCAHASVGWIVMALLPMLVLAAFFSAQRLFGLVPNGTIHLGSRIGTVSLNHFATGSGLVVATFAGLLVFEVLVYVGVRQCRFANPPSICP